MIIAVWISKNLVRFDGLITCWAVAMNLIKKKDRPTESNKLGLETKIRKDKGNL